MKIKIEPESGQAAAAPKPVGITLDGALVQADGSKTILDLCKEKGVKIPTLCYHASLFPESRCRICMVEMDGKLVPACSTKPREGSVISTGNDRVKRARQLNINLMIPKPLSCSTIDDNEICDVYNEVGIEFTRFEALKNYLPDLGSSVIRDNNKCINCGRCVRVCAEIQGVYAIDFSSRGYSEHVSPYSEKNLADVACIKCGQCILNCPVGAISERSHINEVQAALADKSKIVVAQTAPSIRAALGELFGMGAGALVTGKMVSSLRMLGFEYVFDVNLGADMTIMEEASEFLRRLGKGGKFPMITTCCPGWILMMEHFYPGLFPHMSTCKSPHEMLGMLTKTYWAKKAGVNPKDIVVVSVMPCTAKKFESTRPEMESGVDYVLTTRELGRLIKMGKIDFSKLPDEAFDPALGVSTGAGAVFGASGGVMEAALRTAYEFAEGKPTPKLEFEEIRGMKGIKEGSIAIKGKDIKFACASGGMNIRKLLEKKDDYQFLEMMACPGGCIGGGGQPIYQAPDTLQKRMQAIYQADRSLPLRKSHENPVVKQIYSEFLDHPGSEKAEMLLHTTYTKRDRF